MPGGDPQQQQHHYIPNHAVHLCSFSLSLSVSEAAAAAFVTGACLLVYYLAWPMNIVIEEEIGI